MNYRRPINWTTPRFVSAAHRKSALRRAAAIALRPVPVGMLVRAAGRGGVAASVARGALRGRDPGEQTIAEGVGAGLIIDPGRSNPDYAIGTNELPVQQAVAKLVAPGSVVYDVGANIGFFTLIFARLCGPDGLVYAFEADAANATLARRNVARNGFDHVIVSARACGAHNGFVTLHLAPYIGGHSIVATGTPATDVGEVTVEVTRLDDFAALDGVRPPDLVKIDVEGAEEIVLDGMVTLLATRRPVLLIELDDSDQAVHDRRADALIERLRAIDYQVERLADAYPEGGWVVSHWVARPAAESASGELGAEQRCQRGPE